LDASLNVLTIATGKKIYIDMAVNLARSFHLWNADAGIDFYLVTDQQQYLPADVRSYVKVIKIETGEFGYGFSPKINLDKLAPGGQTLFIDSDCLVYGNLREIFDKFKGHGVSVVGNYISEGNWFGDIKAVCEKFNISRLPKFNGGVYYLEKGDIAAKTYETARSLEKRYDEIGFVRFRGREADEMLMSLAMELNGETPITDDGCIMSDPLCCQGAFSTNVIKGKALLRNPPKPDPLHQNWYPFEKVQPLVVHFLGHHTQGYQYKKETYRLKKLSENKLNFFSESRALISIEAKGRLIIFLKNKLRNIYHKLFGIRQIERSERL
jgi:hypothetical protein